MSKFDFPQLHVIDPKRFGRVAVLLGGDSSEREVSLNSGANVLEALQSRGVDAHAVDGLPALLDEIRAGKVDRVFNIMHGGDGENGVAQGVLQALKVPYTGPGVLGSALTLDKIRTKQVWIAAGLPTPRFKRIAGARTNTGREMRAAAKELGFPVFVKPSNEGSSVGAFRVLEEKDLVPAVEFAKGYAGEMLMEQMIVGDELTIGVLGDVVLPSIRIVPKGQWYDYHAKYVAEDTQYLCPGLKGKDEAELRRIVGLAFKAADCSGWGRIDVMRDRASGRFFLLEVNTAPGMTSHSLVPKAAKQVGISFEELCWRILEQTVLERTAEAAQG